MQFDKRQAFALAPCPEAESTPILECLQVPRVPPSPSVVAAALQCPAIHLNPPSVSPRFSLLPKYSKCRLFHMERSGDHGAAPLGMSPMDSLHFRIHPPESGKHAGRQPG